MSKKIKKNDLIDGTEIIETDDSEFIMDVALLEDKFGCGCCETKEELGGLELLKTKKLLKQEPDIWCCCCGASESFVDDLILEDKIKVGIDATQFSEIKIASANNIMLGSIVRVNQNAQTWATGQGIPTWVRGSSYSVLEIRNNGTELLLSDVISWIRSTDVTLVSGGGNGGNNNTPPTSGGSVVVGSSVTLSSSAVWYGTSTIVPQFARTRVSQVLEINGNRVVITYQGGVVGAVRLQDLILVSGGGTPGGGNITPPTSGGGGVVVGSSVTLSSSATWYGTSTVVPQFARTRVSQVVEIIGNRVVISYQGGIVGAVNLRDIVLVSGGGTPGGGNGGNGTNVPTTGGGNVRNRISSALGSGPNDRSLNSITQIVIHHSANPTNGNHLNTATFENHWRGNTGMGFPNDNRGGYHEVVLFNGNVEVNMQDERRTWGAAGQNGHTWHIAVTGQHAQGINNITSLQLEILVTRIAAAMRRFGWNANHLDRIVRHRDVQGQATSCNDIDLNRIRNQVRNLLVTERGISNIHTRPVSNNDVRLMNDKIREDLINVHKAIGIEGPIPNFQAPNLVFNRHEIPISNIGATCFTPVIERSLVIQNSISTKSGQDLVISDGEINMEWSGVGNGVLNMFQINSHFGEMFLPEFLHQASSLFGFLDVSMGLVFDDHNRPGLEIVISHSVNIPGANPIEFESILTLTPVGNTDPTACLGVGGTVLVSSILDTIQQLAEDARRNISRALPTFGAALAAAALGALIIVTKPAWIKAVSLFLAKQTILQAINGLLVLWGVNEITE